MNTAQRIAKNTTVLLVTQAISHILTFFSVMYTARYLEPASYGILSFALAFTALFAFLPDIGLSSLTVREVARDKSLAPKYIIHATVIKLILAGVFFGLMALIVNAMGYTTVTITVVYLLAFYTVIQSFSQMFYAMFQAYERMEYQALGDILNSILMFIGIMLSIYYGLGVVSFAGLHCGAGITVLAVNFIIFIFKFGSQVPGWLTSRVSIDWDFLKRTLKAALPFTLTIAISGLFLRLDIVMLSSMKGDSSVGYYNAVSNLIIVLLHTSSLFIVAVFPVMSRFFVTSRDSLKIIMDKSSKYLLIVSLPVAAGTFILADRIILTIYGADYYPAAIALKILIFAIPLRFIGHATGWTLASINREPLRTVSVVIAVAVNIVLNLILIPRYGITGASVATVISWTVMSFLFQYFVGKNFHWLPLHKIIIKPMIACAAMGSLVYSIREESLLMVIPVAAILYFIVLLVLKTFDKKDVKILRDIVRGLNSRNLTRAPAEKK